MEDPGTGFFFALSEQQLHALVVSMLLVAHADGDFAASERVRIRSSLQQLIGDDSCEEHFETAVDRASTMSSDADAFATLAEELGSPDVREVALVLSCDIAHADGRIVAEERRCLELMHEVYGIESPIVETMLAEMAELAAQAVGDASDTSAEAGTEQA